MSIETELSEIVPVKTSGDEVAVHSTKEARVTEDDNDDEIFDAGETVGSSAEEEVAKGNDWLREGSEGVTIELADWSSPV
jgi:hypothetical protein